MDLLHLHSPPLTALPSSLSVLNERASFLSGQALQVTQTRKCPPPKNLKFVVFGAPAPVLVQGKIGSSLGKVKAVRQESLAKDDDIAFVAGATGRVGSRAVRELLKLGFHVRACVRSKQKAEPLVQSVREMKVDDEFQPVEKLQIVECDLEKRQEIGPAIGNASLVLCCIGASEKEVFDITGPYRIDYMATKNLIDAATVAKVNHFILLTSLGTNKIGFPAAILNLFWGVLIWKRKAEEALLASGLAYTIVRPGGMERPTDSYKETHNLVLSNEDTLFGGQVSNLQVAELMAVMAKNRNLSFCKVVEVIAETTAPLTPMEELLAKIPSQRVDTSVPEKLPSGQKLESTSSKIPAPEAPTLEPIQAEAKKPSPLSPFISYEDLKPPTSPTPTPSTAQEPKYVGIVVGSETQVSLSEHASGVTERSAEVDKPRPLSPYTMYADLKPPSSPSPSA
ncbi:protein TIC 62, chloroplastic [Aristolochia californica]|uniref:protein TIC 62, chloroplastic n=1 Tax=Aristolochia californica TaxID=171875 RepID=UPI0035E2618F